MTPPRRPSSPGGETALGAQLAHGEVLDDPVLDVVEAGVVGVEHGAGVHQVEVVLGPLVPRDLEDGVEPGAHPAVLGALLGHALQPVDLAADGVVDLLRQFGVGELRPVLAHHVVSALAKLVADRLHLLAEEVLALALLDAPGGVLADLGAQLELGQRLVHPAEHLVESIGDIEGLQDLDLLLHAEVGGVGGEIGELAGVVDVQDALRHGADAPELHDLADHGAELGGLSGQRFIGVDDRAPPAPPRPTAPRCRRSGRSRCGRGSPRR